MVFLVLFPAISMGILIIAAFISTCKRIGKSYDSYPSIDAKMPDGEEYKDKVGTPERDNRTLAQQFDGRLTNIVRNPLEGIL